MNNDFHGLLEKQMDSIHQFERELATQEAKNGKGFLQRLRERERNQVLKCLDLKTKDSWLIDVGCGTGFYSLIAKAAGLKVYSVDLDIKMAMRLQTEVDETEVAGIETIEIERTFDQVLCTEALNTVEQPGLAFQNLCRLVSPGGKLVLLCRRYGILGMLNRWFSLFRGKRLNLFTQHSLVEIAEREGLKLNHEAYQQPMSLVLTFQRPKVS